MKINGSVVLISGASTGIGRASALLFAKRGAKLAIASRNREALESIATEIKAQGNAEVLVIPTDITKDSDVQAMVTKTKEHFGRIDILLNNAGVGGVSRIETMPIPAFQAIIDVNIFGMVRAVQAVIPIMRQQGGGLIMNTSSMTSRQLWLALGAYSSTKHALNCLSETLRGELAPDNIRVSVVFPDNTSTDFMKGLTVADFSVLPSIGDATTPMPAETPEYVAERIVFAAETEPREQYMHQGPQPT
jgi:NAD(P)-dependent dehydrogenase (short-subunit alcohol dehydrogenase family)